MIYSKVKASGASGAVVTIIVWVAFEYGVDIPAGVGEAMVVLVSFIAGYVKTERHAPNQN